jgi:hypothetical protein
MLQPTPVSSPRIYRPDRSMKLVFAISGCVLLLFGGIFTFLFGKLFALYFTANGAALPDSSRANQFLMLLVVVCGALAVLMCAIGATIQLRKLSRFFVALTADSIHFQSPFGSYTLRFDEILGKRNHVAAGRFGDACTLLIPKDGKRRTLPISSDFLFDDVYAKWLASLPDLDSSILAGPSTAPLR